jgi:hypothetical protein
MYVGEEAGDQSNSQQMEVGALIPALDCTQDIIRDLQNVEHMIDKEQHCSTIEHVGSSAAAGNMRREVSFQES